ncbi:MAG TPA: hypothetical protein VGA35_00990 [bacterium]
MATDALEVRIAHMEGAYEQIDKRLGSIENRMASLEQKLDRQFLWILGLLIVSILLPIASRGVAHWQ